jgi:hypothetical protein
MKGDVHRRAVSAAKWTVAYPERVLGVVAVVVVVAAAGAVDFVVVVAQKKACDSETSLL